MFCPNCFSQVPDDVTICPFCKVDISKKRFKVNIPEEKIEDVFSSLPERKDEPSEVPADTAADEPDFEPEEAGLSEEAEETEPHEEGEPLPEEEPEEAEEAEEKEEKTPICPKENPDPIREKKEKRARGAVVALTVLCAVTMAALTYVGKTTDIFKVSSGQVKTVALSGFTQAERSSFEDYAVFFSALASTGYNSGKTSQTDLLELMKPEKGSGLYAAFFEPERVITEEADPAKRFSQEDGSYLYCKAPKENVQNICKSLGIEVPDYSNTEKFYYYDGFYYFAPAAGEETSDKKCEVKVDSSKRTEDGNYYVQCTLTTSDGETQTVYCIVSLSKQEEKISFCLLELSAKELFGADGTRIQSEENGGLTYEMKKEVFEAKTSSGVHFADYILEYPYFTGTDDNESAKAAATTLNALYADKLLKYKDNAGKADKLYSRFKKNGGSKEELPLFTYTHTEVTYNEKGYISLLEETNEYVPAPKAEEPATSAYEYGNVPVESEEPPVFPVTTFDGYTLVVESCELLKKSDVLGSEHQEIQQKLYEIYYKARHETDETTGEFVIPEDTDGIGQLITSSAWCLNSDGVLFSFCNSQGIAQNVLLSFEEADGESKL